MYCILYNATEISRFLQHWWLCIILITFWTQMSVRKELQKGMYIVLSLPLSAHSLTSAIHCTAIAFEHCRSFCSCDSLSASSSALLDVKNIYNSNSVCLTTGTKTYMNMKHTFTYLVERASCSVSFLWWFQPIACTVSMSTRAGIRRITLWSAIYEQY